MLWAVYLASEGASWERGARWVFFGSLPISHLTPVPSRVCGRGARMCRARETLRVSRKSRRSIVSFIGLRGKRTSELIAPSGRLATSPPLLAETFMTQA